MSAATPNPSDLLLTVPECAHALSISDVHVYRLEASGALPSVRTGPRRALRFRARDVAAYLDRRRRSADAEAARAARVASALHPGGG